jgi:hypothetical protein
MPPALFALVILEIRYCFFLGLVVLNCNLPMLMLPVIAGMTGVCHHTQLLVDMGSCKFFAAIGLK